MNRDLHEYLSAQLLYMDVNLAIFPDGRTTSKTTPLLYAIKDNKKEFVKVLLDSGADVNLSFFLERCDADPEYSDVTPLLFAIQQKCSLEIIQSLLSRNPNLDAIGSSGKSAFALALENDLDSVTEAIMNKNLTSSVDFFCKNISSVQLSRWSAIGFFRQIINFEILDQIAQLSLISGCYGVLEVLIQDTFYTLGRIQSKCYCDNIPSSSILNSGFTLLHFAVNYDLPSAVDYLIKGMKELMTKVDEFGASPFHYACSKNTVDILDIFLAHGVDTTRCTGSGVSPLHIAASNPNCDVVFKKLIQLGATITNYSLDNRITFGGNKFSECGLTGNYFDDGGPLITAIKRNNSTVVRHLLASGVDVDHKEMIIYCLRNSYGRSLSELCGHLPIPTHLWDRAEKELFLEIDGKDVLYYLAGRNTPTLQDAFPLVEFCIRQLDCHPDGYARFDKENNSPLHVALTSGNFYFLEALVVYGANVNLKMSLHVVCDLVVFEKVSMEQGMELTKFLLRNGANSQFDFGLSSSALSYALNCGLYELVSLMIELDTNAWGVLNFNSVPFLHFILAKMVNNPVPRYFRKMLPVSLETKVNLVAACIKRGVDINKKCHSEQSFPSFRKNLKYHSVLHIAFAFFDAPFCAALDQFGPDTDLVTDENECILQLTLSLGLGNFGQGNITEFTEKVVVMNQIGVNLNKECPDSVNAKMIPYKKALSKGNVAVAEILLQYGGLRFEYDDVEISIESGNLRVAENIRNQIIQEILSGNTSVATVFCTRWNPAACFRDRIISFLQDLINRGYYVNTVDYHGNSLMHFLAAFQWPTDQEFSEKIVKFIISVGGWIDTVNKCGQSPLHRAVSRMASEDRNLQLLCTYFPEKISNHNQHLVSALVTHGADVDRRTLRGWSAMHMALNSNICVTNLIEFGAPINSSQIPPNHLPEMCQECMVSEVDWILLGFNPLQSISPLSIAIAKNHKKLIELLLVSGATVSLSEIHSCLIFGDSDWAIQLLPSLAQEVSLQNDVINGIPALQLFFYAMCNPPNTRRTILQGYNVRSDNSAIAVVEKYIERGYELSVQDPVFPPILFSVIRRMFDEANFQSLSLVRELIELNAPINVHDPEGNSLLTYVLISGRPSCEGQCGDSPHSNLFRTIRRETLQLLIDNFADTNMAHFHSYTYHEEDDDILRLLLKANTYMAYEWTSVRLCQRRPSHQQPFAAMTTLVNQNRNLSLMHLSRIAVRQIPDFADDFHDIGIPEIIQDFLTFKEN